MACLKTKLVALKEMLKGVQDGLVMDYKVDESLQDAIDVCDEAIIMCSIEPLHSTPISGDRLVSSPEV